MQLSVIIVSYNVRYFLEQCLHSVFRAMNGIDGEVVVVDNHSADGSEVMVRSKFPEVRLIVNDENIGFSKANNQAVRISGADYVLLLNPDTIVEEETFRLCLKFMESHPSAGCLGPKMIDGTGRFLPESKRGLPSPEVAFWKIFGLTRLFPTPKGSGNITWGICLKMSLTKWMCLPEHSCSFAARHSTKPGCSTKNSSCMAKTSIYPTESNWPDIKIIISLKLPSFIIRAKVPSGEASIMSSFFIRP